MVTTPTRELPRFDESTPIGECVATLQSDAPTLFKREALSAIGRRRDRSNKGILLEYSDSLDPDLVLQALRGLLVFRDDADVAEHLYKFAQHPNDMVRDIVAIELNGAVEEIERAHAASPEFLHDLVVHGDVSRILESIPDRSIHLTFTSPPYYNARDYSKYRSYEEYLDLLEDVFRKVHRVTKEGRFLVVNTSPVIVPRAGRKYSSRRYGVPYDLHSRLVSHGWEFVDDIVWVKPEKAVKNRVSGFETYRKPLTYKANARTEMVMVYRRQSHKLIDWNLRQYSREVVQSSKVSGQIERSNIWEIAPVSDPRHSAVFPRRLCDRVVRYYSFLGDLVFDPFAGSGTVGDSATEHGRHYLLAEVNARYVDLMAARLRRASAAKAGGALRIVGADEFGRLAN